MRRGVIFLLVLLPLLLASCSASVQPVQKNQDNSPVYKNPQKLQKDEVKQIETDTKSPLEGVSSGSRVGEDAREVSGTENKMKEEYPSRVQKTDEEPPVKSDEEKEGSPAQKPGDSSEEKIYYTGKAVVLTYHEISPKPITGIIIKPERFEADLKMLRDNNFNVISLKDMIKAVEGEGDLPPNAVVITFDDGYEGVYKYAYPLLKEYNMPATNFVITSYAQIGPREGAKLTFSGDTQLKEMSQSGLIDIQSHSHESHDYTVRNAEGRTGGLLAFQKYDKKTSEKEPIESYKNRVINDLKTSIKVIEEYTGSKSDILCFPFGHYNSRLVEIAKKAGFKYFVTTSYGYNKEGSKKIMIKRIRSGDLKLTSDKLKENIIACGRGE